VGIILRIRIEGDFPYPYLRMRIEGDFPYPYLRIRIEGDFPYPYLRIRIEGDFPYPYLRIRIEVLPMLLSRNVFRTGSFPARFRCSADFRSEPRFFSGKADS
jgi:hypothetical protein